MAIQGSLLKINGQNLPSLKEYKVTYSKLWSGAERNMNGEVRATLVGIFPKLELEFGGVLDSSAIQSACGLLDRPYFSVEFYNPKTRSKTTAQYYASDYSVELMERDRELYKPFKVNLIPVARA